MHSRQSRYYSLWQSTLLHMCRTQCATRVAMPSMSSTFNPESSRKSSHHSHLLTSPTLYQLWSIVELKTLRDHQNSNCSLEIPSIPYKVTLEQLLLHPPDAPLTSDEKKLKVGHQLSQEAHQHLFFHCQHLDLHQTRYNNEYNYTHVQ